MDLLGWCLVMRSDVYMINLDSAKTKKKLAYSVGQELWCWAADDKA
jgi:hypothetical protein